MVADAHCAETPPRVTISSNGESTGGQGGPGRAPFRHPSPSDDARLEAQALRSGWAVPEQYKAAMVKRQITIALDPKSSERDATRAFVAARAGDPEFLERAKSSVNQNVNVNAGPTVIQLVPQLVTTHAEAAAALEGTDILPHE